VTKANEADEQEKTERTEEVTERRLIKKMQTKRWGGEEMGDEAGNLKLET
jgi:hypothetical protein